jgi:hypothetical protein
MSQAMGGRTSWERLGAFIGLADGRYSHNHNPLAGRPGRAGTSPHQSLPKKNLRNLRNVQIVASDRTGK